MDRRFGRAVLPLLSLSLFALYGCPQAPQAPPAGPPAAISAPAPKGMPDLPPDPRALKAGKPAEGTQAPLPGKAVAGGALNKFFPNDADGFDRVFTQEKNGFAMANLKKGGKKVASLSINDTAASPSTRDKFKSASRKIGGYPAVSEGMSSGLAILVADRYQVKIRAEGPELSDSDLEAWLQKFDLAGLAALK